jgi:hypothetical protein
MQSLEEQDVIERRLEALRERHRDFPDRRHPLASLVQAIVWCAKAHAEAITLEASATARRPMADVVRDEERLLEDELARARESVPDLEDGLRLARAAGDREVAFDSRDPVQDRVAGAVISTLVASDFATVRTEELGNEQYRYHVAVLWPVLDAFAARLGLPPVAEMLAL